MHKKTDNTCYLCMKLGEYGTQANLEEHHVFFGNSNRKNSTKYGLMVYLCSGHHRDSKEGVHFNKEYDEMLKQEGQQMFERTHTREEFMSIFGRNWL